MAKKTTTSEQPAIVAELLVNPTEYGLDINQGHEIETQFLPVIADRENLAVEYAAIVAQPITPETEKAAKELRLKLVKVRTNTDAIHKAAKAFYLAGGRFVDAWKNKNNTTIEQMESALREIETTTERIEAARIQQIADERETVLAQFTTVIPSGLGTMDAEIYENYLLGVKMAHEMKQKAAAQALADAIEADRIIALHSARKDSILSLWQYITDERPNFGLMSDEDWEEYRQSLLARKTAAAIEDERIRIENEKLQAEIAERKKAEETARKKAAEELQKANAERERLTAELAAKQAEETRIKAEADRKAAEAEKAAKIAAKAPDKEKMKLWIDSLNIAVPELNDLNAMATAGIITQKFDAFKAWAKQQIETI